MMSPTVSQIKNVAKLFVVNNLSYVENTVHVVWVFSFQFAVFEPGTRNTGSSVAGRNIANPIAMLNAACDMLEHLGLHTHGSMIRNAINKTLSVNLIHTAG